MGFREWKEALEKPNLACCYSCCALPSSIEQVSNSYFSMCCCMSLRVRLVCVVCREREREGERGGFARIYTVLSEYVRSRTFFLPASGEYASEFFQNVVLRLRGFWSLTFAGCGSGG